MPSAAAKKVRRRPSSRDAGSRRRQRQELSAAEILRQQTLTQIGWIARLEREQSPGIDLSYEVEQGTDIASPELGGDYEEADKQRPGKKRRTTTGRASVSPTSGHVRHIHVEGLLSVKSHSSPGPVKVFQRDSNRPIFLPRLESPGKQQRTATKTSTQATEDKALMPPPFIPRTPSRQTARTYVPSSQSPDVTPLSIRTVRTVRQTQRSPLKDKSPNTTTRRTSGFKKPPNPFNRFAGVHTSSSGAEEESNAGTASPQRPKKPGTDIPHLHFNDQKTPRSRRVTALEDSPDIRANRRVSGKPAKDLLSDVRRSANKVANNSGSDPATKSSDSTPLGHLLRSFSQASTQDPTQYDSEKDAEHPLPVLRTFPSTSYSQPVILDSGPAELPARIPSSQVTTQRHTECQRPEPVHGLEPDVEPKPIEAPRVPSSQASTVVPSSDPTSDLAAYDESQRKRRKVTTSRSMDGKGKPYKSKPMENSMSAMLTSSQALDDWEWDGRDWTESQLLPASLMNFPLPDLPLASSQSSMTSLDGAEVDVPLKSHQIEHGRIEEVVGTDDRLVRQAGVAAASEGDQGFAEQRASRVVTRSIKREREI